MKTIKNEKSDRLLFERMLSKQALNYAEPYLSHEAMALRWGIQELRGIDNVVVVGAGPQMYLDMVRAYRKNYIGIDPHFSQSRSHARTLILKAFFEEVDRSWLLSGHCLFVFWFNVFFYLALPELRLSRMLRQGDAILVSQWVCSDAARLVMNKYFEYVYRGSGIHHCLVIQEILESTAYDLSWLNLQEVEDMANEVNRVKVGYVP